ncbi:MAG: GNAT family N-acetyltransferase [Bacilli bacterium]|nr:GNAT family N-acetyltransferase [Bacilli bacterium]
MLLDQLNQENPSESSFIWDFKEDIVQRCDHYLESNDILNSPFAIKVGESIVGYLEISKIFPEHYVDLVYALLLNERRKGYATRTILEVSKYLLTEYKNSIKTVTLAIDPENVSSIAVAKRCGFKTYDDEQAERDGIYIFEKNLIDLDSCRTRKN